MSGEVLGCRTVTKSRLEHTCYWCGESIPIGSTYDLCVWAQDGELDVIKTHPECQEAWHKAADEEGGYYETMPYEHKRGEVDD